MRQGLRSLDDAARAKDCFEICDDHPGSRPLFARTVLVDGEAARDGWRVGRLKHLSTRTIGIRSWLSSSGFEHILGQASTLQRVFITENRVNGLSFPDCRESIIVFGLGYGPERLADIPWMRTVDVQYWGDIDTHGFGILNRLRAHLPHAQSFLMNPDTLHAHRSLWGQEPVDRRYTGDTALLTPEERALFDDLRLDRLGDRVRLEQERVSYTWLQRALRRLDSARDVSMLKHVSSWSQQSGVD